MRPGVPSTVVKGFTDSAFTRFKALQPSKSELQVYTRVKSNLLPVASTISRS
ncbi:hypothetical protein CY34DRAFT_805890 [Suillus luteus UH-Slu-Lm8-n1]|uniref:Unplaced genomic scaffold CY34scaffold_133, whole genome shotgun sequence n=1 Tax=Suillus luteus UH-Slu-Lm8-n1 TaxID=930992 RepID=A0A0D0AUH0_9AGAM|nr:hypothetical protein CY34DRAFT_805890 [Suillus luteus UH-Slu-Lm8-n1]